MSKESTQVCNGAMKMKEICSQNKARIDLLYEKLSNNELETKNGVSLLQIRLLELLSYSTYLTLFSLQKLNGTVNSAIINQLIEKRLRLEKTKPLELKLKYQIDKLLKQSQTLDIDDPLNFKPNIEFLKKSSTQEKVSTNHNEIYKAPKMTAKPYVQKSAKITENQRERASKSRLLKDLAQQYDERPDEIDAEGTGYGQREIGASKEDEEFKERQAFEEENFIRLNLTRKDKKMEAKMNKQGGLIRFKNEFDDLKRDFNDISGVKNAVQRDEKNKPKVSKRVQKAGDKRMYEDADDMITKMAKTRRSSKGKDQFSAQKRLSKAFGGKKSKK